MGESDGHWGALAEHDTDLAGAWDTYDRLPEPGVNPVLDAFCESKSITIEALVRLGCRLAETDTLVFAYDGGIKFRNMITGDRWSFPGSTWSKLKVIPASAESAETWAIVCEGETDAARLTALYPTLDVAVMPAGAKHWGDDFTEQLAAYPVVLVGLDNDKAGNEGTAKALAALPNGVEFRPPENDWCRTADDEAPSLEGIERPQAIEILVAAGDLLELEVPEAASWFEHELLPISGLLMLHGWAKSFKSFLAFDMLSSLAQGVPWCGFESIEEPCRVAVVQYEITWPYYRQRIQLLREHAAQKDLFDQNFLTWEPMRRPQLVAGNKKQEDRVLAAFVEAGVQVALIDPIRRATGAIDMNSEQEVRRMLTFFERLQDEGITVVATHHDNKEGAKAGGGNPLSMTGSGAWTGDPDSIVSVALPRGERLNSSPHRNLYFTLRNAPMIDGRSMQIHEDGRIEYSTSIYGDWDDDNTEDTDNEPAI